jgi:hypothetical protein
MKNVKAVLSVRFNSTYGSKDLVNLFQNDLEDFKNVPGLIQKYYVAEENTGVNGGIYVFENKETREAFWNSKLAKSIPGRYGVKLETLRVEELNVTIDMNETVLA